MITKDSEKLVRDVRQKMGVKEFEKFVRDVREKKLGVEDVFKLAEDGKRGEAKDLMAALMEEAKNPPRQKTKGRPKRP